MNATQPQVKERTAADLLNLLLPALGEVSDINLPTSEVAVEFKWKQRIWKVDKNLRVVNGGFGATTWTASLETTLMERLLALAQKIQ
jgi:hypothetical protein